MSGSLNSYSKREKSMTTTRRGSRGGLTFLTAPLVLLVACLLGPSAARAQWTQPDAANNISNTNTGNVGINVTAPVFRFEVRGTGSRNTASFFGDGDSAGYAGIRIAAFTTTGIASNRTSTFNLHMRKDTWYGGDGSGPSFIIETTSTAGGFAAPFLITPTNDVILNGGKGASGLSYGNVGVGTTAPTGKFDLTVNGAPNGGGIDFVVRDGVAANSNPIAFSHKVGTTSGALTRIGFNVYSNETNYAVINPAAGGWAIQSDTRNGISAPSLQFSSFTTTPTKIDVLTLLQGGNVGIGTVSPGYRLDVAGSVNASGLCLGGTCKSNWAEISGSDSQWANGTSGAISYSAGNVGIGTASPTEKLHVTARSRFGNIMVGETRTGGAEPNGEAIEAFGHLVLMSQPGSDIRLGVTGAPTRMILNSAGNVGIGTAAPAQKLHVFGGNVFHQWNAVAGQEYGFYTSIRNNHLTSNLFFDSQWKMMTAGKGAFISTAPLDGNAFVVLADNTARAAGATASFSTLMTVTMDGKVGVGTNAPTYSLDVNGGTNGFRAKAASSSASDAVATFENSSGIQAIIRANGNVGVGMTNPAHKLDVAGSVNASGLCLGGSCKSNWSEVEGGTPSQWVNGANSSINYGAGNVGIGTTTPIRGFQVSGPNGSGSSEFILENTGMPANNRKLNLWGSAATGAAGRFFLRLLNDAGNATTREFMSFDNASGYVGIGTVNPTQMLEVSGPGEVKARAAGTTSAAIQLQESSGTATWSEWQQYTDRLRLNTHDGTTTRADVMSVLPNGNVGIGKANPTEALDVVGNIKATGSVSATYQDVAEWVPSVQKLQAGTVVVLDTGRNNHVMASASAYDTKVAGVVSAQPGVILGVEGEDKVKVATTGRVKVKVDATRGAILVGDLLVTSEVEGVAMKSVPVELGGTRIHRPGTIIGKALEPLEKGVGEILVLLSLQ